MRKKLVLALVVTMILSTVPSFALTETTHKTNPTTPEITELEPIINNLLGTIQNDSDSYGLGNVNFENLYLGEKLAAYQENNNQIEELNIDYYPVMEDNEVIAIATVTYTETGAPSVQLGKGFSDNLQDFSEEDDSVALVFDESGENMYACDNADKYIVVDTFITDSDSNGTEKFDGVEDEDITYTKVAPTVDLDADKNQSSEVSLSENLLAASSDANSLNIPIKLQNGKPICWAASVASVGQYITGIKKSATGVCDALGCEYTSGSSIMVKNAFKKIYKLSATIYDKAPSFSKIMSEINNDQPIWAGFNCAATGAGHAVVIRGYASGSNYATFSYMDPNSSSFQVSNVTADGDYRFAYGSDTYKCKRYVEIN